MNLAWLFTAALRLVEFDRQFYWRTIFDVVITIRSSTTGQSFITTTTRRTTLFEIRFVIIFFLVD